MNWRLLLYHVTDGKTETEKSFILLYRQLVEGLNLEWGLFNSIG